MRIIGGEKRGMNLLSPKGMQSRPITDRVKESLFNVFYNYGLPAGKIVADVFCGVGSLGLEALSRGAEAATFVEQDGRIIDILKKNIEKAGFTAKSRVIRADAFRVGAAVSSGGQKYDLVFIDPPYILSQEAGPRSKLAGLLSLLPKQIKAGAIVVVRTENDVTLLERYNELAMIERRQWGTMAVTMFMLEQLKNEQ